MKDRKKKLEEFVKDLQLNYKLPKKTINKLHDIIKELYNPNMPEKEVDHAIQSLYKTCKSIHQLEKMNQKKSQEEKIDLLNSSDNIRKIIEFYEGLTNDLNPKNETRNSLKKKVTKYNN